jgi:hypothetical protein
MYFAEPAQADDANADRFHYDAALFHVADEFLEAHLAIFTRVHSVEPAVGVSILFFALHLVVRILVDALECFCAAIGAALRRLTTAISKFL